jgi:non-specific serine/threonine protein kinase
VAVGQPEPAAHLIGWADAARERIINPRPFLEQANIDQLVAACLARMGAVAFWEAYEQGKKMSLDEAVAHSLDGGAPGLEQTVEIGRSPRQAGKETFGGLTAREREVAEHIARGESNREIAEALVVTERTVESHVTNILNKLRFTNRAQVRKWAVEKGMVKRME